MKHSLLFLACSASFAATAQTRHAEAGSVSPAELKAGIALRRVPLQHAALPAVRLEAAQYAAATPRPADTALPTGVQVVVGVDRKQPFALVAIPTRRAGGREALQSFTLVVEEPPATVTAPGALAKVTAGASDLASGAWHKIAVKDRGFYKVDYAFLSGKLGASTVASSAIRLLGNGGTMLPEANAPQMPAAPAEVALWMQDGGDGTFGPGDYFVFYAPGPTAWVPDSSGSFRHRKNLYADSSYYFLTVNGANGLRIGAQASAPTPTTTVTSYDAYAVLDDDKVNLAKFGKRWVGDEFTGGSKSYSLELGTSTGPVRVRTSVAARNSGAPEAFALSANGQSLTSALLTFRSTNAEDYPSTGAILEGTAPAPAGRTTSVSLSFTPYSSISRGYLDYIELNGRCALAFSNGQLQFRDWQSMGAGAVAGYQLQGATSGLQVWDVTDAAVPVRMAGTLSGGTYSFSQDASTLREFAAFDGSVLGAPSYVKPVGTQNLRGQGAQDYLIVTAPQFLSAAERLATWHRQRGLRVLVATTEQVYNEFSSGSQDIGGIRDFARYFYDRAGTDVASMPKYLLLFGDASYDYKDRIGGNTNYVPVFESSESDVTVDGYTTDDYFGFLDAGENAEGNDNTYNVLDLGVGRLPVKTPAEADVVVAKVMRYKSAASLGPWRVSNTLVADNADDAGNHLDNTEAMASVLRTSSPVFNDAKIYLDNIPTVSSPGGTRAPEANAQINNQIYKGTLFINYSGHGGTKELAHERILTADDYNRWTNADKLPFMVTATCDFAQYDRPDFVSAGENLVLKSDGGTIAMLTTTQAVYADQSVVLNYDYLAEQFKQDAGNWLSFGEALRRGKNAAYSITPQAFPDGNWRYLLNFRKFALLGDPALVPNLPARLNAVRTDSLVDMATGQRADTLSALGAYSLNGSVQTPAGSLDASFNGRVYVTAFDKPRSVSVVQAARGNTQRTYQIQNNIVFKGRATVTNGTFSLPFVVPKDLNYDFGAGFIQYYVEDGTTDAAGDDTTVTVGGASDHPVEDEDAPVVKAYIGDSLFRQGGLTGTNTVLFAILEDKTGINVSGNAVGHDLTAILDGHEEAPYILNDYYESAPNTYQRGYVRFPVTGLSDGLHTFTIKAWDVANNSGTGSVRFEVSNGSVTRVQNLVNYPNPFSTQTRFRFEHNHPDEALTAEVYIYNTSGGLVRRLTQDFTPTGSHSSEIIWDGAGDNGGLLPSGIYPYRLMITTAKGTEGFGYQKLVIAR